MINGHVHAYERTHPVSHGGVDLRHGIPHITVGDGGNREHFATPWVEEQPPWSALREYACTPQRSPPARAHVLLLPRIAFAMCPLRLWRRSLLRPDGWGTLELNQTHMVWSFLRNNDPWNPPGGRVGDQAVYTRDAAA